MNNPGPSIAERREATAATPGDASARRGPRR